jgi:hypothetical protein
MAMAPMVSPDPGPKMVIVGIHVSHGKVKVIPEHVRIHLGQQLQWVVLAVDGSDPITLEVYFDGESPFPWKDQAMSLNPGQGPRGRPDRLSEQPSVTATPQALGDFKYGVRLRDAYGFVVDDDDPYITVLA